MATILQSHSWSNIGWENLQQTQEDWQIPTLSFPFLEDQGARGDGEESLILIKTIVEKLNCKNEVARKEWLKEKQQLHEMVTRKPSHPDSSFVKQVLVQLVNLMQAEEAYCKSLEDLVWSLNFLLDSTRELVKDSNAIRDVEQHIKSMEQVIMKLKAENDEHKAFFHGENIQQTKPKPSLFSVRLWDIETAPLHDAVPWCFFGAFLGWWISGVLAISQWWYLSLAGLLFFLLLFAFFFSTQGQENT